MNTPQDEGVREFLAEAEDILDGVAGDLLELETSAAADDPDPERINSIFRGAHSLKGISAMFGFSQVTELSHKAETLLDAVRMGRVGCDRGVLDLLFGAVDLLKVLCGRLAAGEAPEDPEVAAFVERLLAAAAGDKVEAAGPL
ncbi:MAG TPA: Hpt domain-containing protein, partial [Deferrisomatales bacterium]|nr:Hpt domain-containing protein [Deferrisomatales bacterium]